MPSEQHRDTKRESNRTEMLHQQYPVFIVLILVVSSCSGNLSIHFDQRSLRPDNEEFLTDASLETCASISTKQEITVPRFTSFRIDTFYSNAQDVTVMLFGNSLGCGYNLYVTPLSRNETEKRTGRWTSCQLVDTSSPDGINEMCHYQCHSSYHCETIQIIKSPRSLEESHWKICHILTSNSVAVGCHQINSTSSGVFPILYTLSDNIPRNKDVFCDMTTDGGGWMVILRRQDGSVDFTREWEDYKEGFGSLTGEFYAGHEFIHQLTTSGVPYTLRVDLESYEEEQIFAEYSQFSIDSESTNYVLHVSGYSDQSTAGNSLSPHNGMQFSTLGRDNSAASDDCAGQYNTSWWYNNCHHALLTGHYGQYPKVAENEGIRWEYPWSSTKFAKYATMMIRPTK